MVVKSARPVKVIRAENTHGLYRVRSATEARGTQLVVLTLTVPADLAQIPDHIDLVIESDKGEQETVSLGIQR